MKTRRIFYGFLLATSLAMFSVAATSTVNDTQNTKSKPIESKTFKVEKIWSKAVFGYNTEGANSYRIPGTIKLANGNLLMNADERIENLDDYNNTINQVFKSSSDNGKTWSDSKLIVKIATPKTGKGLIIDGTFAEVEYTENGKAQTKLIYLFDMFADRAGIPQLMKGNAWVYINGEAYLKLWVRNNGKFDTQNSVLKRVPGKANWWQKYLLPNGVKYNQITNTSELTPTKTYVDNSYNSESKTITGTVYENVEEGVLNNPELLEGYKTQHSIWDRYDVSTTKYFLAKNNQNGMLESFDEGETWTNFKLIDDQIGKAQYPQRQFTGNAVGNGIQLKHQRDKSLNGRVLFATYSYTNGTQNPDIIYSDDFGTNWKNMNVPFMKQNLTESTFFETEEGDLYWFLRHSVWGSGNNKPVFTKSTDGGKTWQHPTNANSTQKYVDINLKADGNVFSGMTSFKLKDKRYFAFALPKENGRYAGSLYVSDDTFTNIQEVYTFDENNQEHFAYSYTTLLTQSDNGVELLVTYEWSPKTKIMNTDKYFNTRPKGGGIQLEKIKLLLK